MSLYIWLIAAYLVGSLSFAIIVSKFMKMDDPREYGSKNAGATNVMRSGNKKAAVFTLIGDFLKGLVVVLLAKYFLSPIQGGDALVALCGILVVIGHIYPVFFKFKGGKGVATAIGAIFGFNAYVALLLIGTWLIVFKISKVSSLSALIATVLAPIYAYILLGNSSYFAGVLVISFFVLYKHKVNIIRLIKGQEHKFDVTKSDLLDNAEKPE
jgi:acyl phosphate:glycerol-3-phosphate acyltransferase